MPDYRLSLLTNRRSHGGQLAEFSVMPVILLLLAIPLINLFGFGMSYGLLAYTSFACVNKAAISPNFDSALAGMEGQAAAMFNGPFGTFFKLAPSGGFNASGCDLYIVTTNIDTQVSSVTGPNKALSNPPDESKNNCQYEVDARADISPLIPLNGIAFLSNIPVISAAASMHCSWAKSAEIPAGLALARAGGATRGGVPTVSLHVDGIDQLNSLTKFTGQTWKNPILYDEIKNGGGSIRNQDVMTVHAKQDVWQETPFFVYPNYRIWIDYKADGHWSFDPSQVQKNGNGEDVTLSGNTWISNNIPGDTGYMIAQFGNSPPMRVGVAKSFQPNGNGQMKLMPFDKDANINMTSGTIGNAAAYKDNAGRMHVRVVITE